MNRLIFAAKKNAGEAVTFIAMPSGFAMPIAVARASTPARPGNLISAARPATSSTFQAPENKSNRKAPAAPTSPVFQKEAAVLLACDGALDFVAADAEGCGWRPARK